MKNGLRERLIPNLPPNYVLVIDNAPYHNVQLNRAPNSNSRRDFMISWLKYHLPPITFNITDFSSMKNPDILLYRSLEGMYCI